MKRIRVLTAAILALALLFGLCAARAEAYYAYTGYDTLIGAMEVVNCTSWT